MIDLFLCTFSHMFYFSPQQVRRTNGTKTNKNCPNVYLVPKISNRKSKIMIPYLVLIGFLVVASADPEFIETVELTYGKYDVYFMSPLEMEEGKIVSFDLFQLKPSVTEVQSKGNSI